MMPHKIIAGALGCLAVLFSPVFGYIYWEILEVIGWGSVASMFAAVGASTVISLIGLVGVGIAIQKDPDT